MKITRVEIWYDPEDNELYWFTPIRREWYREFIGHVEPGYIFHKWIDRPENLIYVGEFLE